MKPWIKIDDRNSSGPGQQATGSLRKVKMIKEDTELA